MSLEKARVKDAAPRDPGAEIAPGEQERLYSSYGLMGEAGACAGQSGGFRAA